MSLRAEVQELVAWLADHRVEPEAPAPTVLVTKEAWELVHGALTRAGDAFVTAADLFVANPARPLLAELSRDLVYESRSLALRARVLKRRAPSRDDAPQRRRAVAVPDVDLELARLRERTNIERAEARKREADAALARAEAAIKQAEVAEVGFRQLSARLATTTDADVRGRLNEIGDLLEGSRRNAAAALAAARGEEAETTGAESRVVSAMNSIEIARGHLTDGTHNDTAAELFAQEVDVLAEMALSLRTRALWATS
jgi:hypothetical protein